jgi:hypothetical protein
MLSRAPTVKRSVRHRSRADLFTASRLAIATITLSACTSAEQSITDLYRVSFPDLGALDAGIADAAASE